jgi:membrane dipeptidase
MLVVAAAAALVGAAAACSEVGGDAPGALRPAAAAPRAVAAPAAAPPSEPGRDRGRATGRPASDVPARALAAPPEAADALHRSAIVVDTHNDVTLRLVDEAGFDFNVRHADGHTDLVRAREGGLDAEFLSVWVRPQRYRGEKAWQRSLAMLDAIDETVAASAGAIVLARTAADVRAAHAAGKVALLIGVEGAHSLGDFGTPEKAIARLDAWHARGVRYLTLTWNNSNELAGSSGDEGRERGVSDLGRRVIAEMNDRGMIVDVSHVSDTTFFAAIEASRLPVLASHSGARALADHGRNLTDDMLRAIAKDGGAACIVYYPGFLDTAWAEARSAAKKAGPGSKVVVPRVPLSKLVDHIDHAVKVAGVDHVCLGSDFDGIGEAPAGLEDVSKLPALTAELVRRGYSDGDVRKILGENVLRVLEANERGAKARP